MANKNKKIQFIYKLEIVYDKKGETVQHICEGISTSNPVGPIDSNFDYLEEYFDIETFKWLDDMYIVGES